MRTAGEHAKVKVPSSVNIPVDELRDRINELPSDDVINVHCGVGVRSYIACRILMQNGFVARNISGGLISYRAYKNVETPDTPEASRLKEEFGLCRTI